MKEIYKLISAINQVMSDEKKKRRFRTAIATFLIFDSIPTNRLVCPWSKIISESIGGIQNPIRNTKKQ